jgi:LacI family transcriptional regulator
LALRPFDNDATAVQDYARCKRLQDCTIQRPDGDRRHPKEADRMIRTRPTLNQVAELAGVSIASVSRALNGRSASANTVERVRAAAAELGYVPDATARSLKLGHALQIAFAVDDVGNPVYVEMMRAIEEVVRKSGYRLVVSSTGSRPSEAIDLVNSLSRGYADGMIISPLRITDDLIVALQTATVPVVVIGSLPQDIDIDTVQTDSAQGVVLAYQHLHDMGHERIAFINGPADTTPGRARARGYGEAARAAGLSDPSVLTMPATDFTVAAGLDAGRELLTRHRVADGSLEIDALIAANDLLALGAIHAAVESGLDVPGDLAIVGVDDIEVASVYNPTLTSVSLQSAARGRHAGELLLQRIASPGMSARRVLVPPELVVRASSKSPTPPSGRVNP